VTKGLVELGTGIATFGALFTPLGAAALAASPATAPLVLAGAGLAIRVGAVNIARGLQGRSDAVSIPVELSKGAFGTAVPGVLFDAVHSIMNGDVLPLIESGVNEAIRQGITDVGSFVKYVLFVPFTASGNQGPRPMPSQK